MAATGRGVEDRFPEGGDDGVAALLFVAAGESDVGGRADSDAAAALDDLERWKHKSAITGCCCCGCCGCPCPCS